MNLQNFTTMLQEEEKSRHTIEKYRRDVRLFLAFLGQQELSKQVVMAFKAMLMANYAPKSVNSMLAGVNKYLDFIGQRDLKIKPIKIQKELFLQPEKELTEREYRRLLQTAEQSGKTMLSLLLQTICATGMRISELQYITVQSLKSGRIHVSCKGKTRVIFLPKSLRSALKEYCKSHRLYTGMIFKTKRGNPLDRSNIWRMMKNLCKKAKVPEKKVFPHNLRHLFARTYYKIHKDISRLADILGHSNINTTRIYTMESGFIHERQLEKLNLLLCKSTT